MKHNTQNILNKTNVLTFCLSADTKIISVSDNLGKVLGYELNQIKGRPVYSIIEDSDLNKFKNLFNEFSLGKKSNLQSLIHIKTKNGRPIQGLITISKDDDPKLTIAIFVPFQTDQTKDFITSEITDTFGHTEVEYKEILRKFPAFVRQHNSRGNCIYMNETLVSYVQGVFTEPNMNAWMDNVHPEDADILKNEFVAALNKKTYYRCEYRLKHNTGVYRWMLEIGRPIYNDLGKFAGIIASVFDIHEIEKTRSQLIESEQKYKSLFENNHSVMLIVDPQNGSIVDANSAAANFYGWSIEELTKKKITEINTLTPAQIKIELANANDGKITKFNFKHKLASGEIRNVETFSGPIQIQNKKLLYSIIHDVTDRFKAEELLKESEERYRLIFDFSPVGIIYFNEKGEVIACNDKFVEIIGASRQAIIGVNMLQLPDKKFVAAVNDAIKGKVGKYIGVYHSYKSKKITPINATFAPYSKHGPVKGSIGIVEDITELYNYELVLKESEERFRNIYENATIGIYRTNIEGEILMANPSFIKMLGYSSFDELKTRRVDSEKYYAKGHSRDDFINKIEKEGFVRGMQTAWKKKNGETIYVQESARRVTDKNGELAYYEGAVENITNKVLAEKALKESEEKINSILNNMVDVVWSMSWPDMELLYLSPSVEKLYGRKVKEFEENPGLWNDVLHPEDKDLVNIAFEDLEKYGFAERETRIIHKNGSVFWIQDKSKFIYDKNGNPIRIEGIASDITLRKSMENTLKESEEKFRLLITQMHQGLAVHEAIFDDSGKLVDYRYIDFNDSFEKITGLKKKDLIGKTIKEILTNTEDYWLEAYEKVVKTGKPLSLEQYAGEFSKYFSVLIYRNRPGQFATMFTDITDRKIIENELLESHERFNMLAKQSRTFTWEVDNKGLITYISPVVEIVLGYKPKELVGKMEIWDLMPEDVRADYKIHGIETMRNKEALSDFENPLVAKDGRIVWVISNVIPIIDDNGNLLGYRGSDLDISKRKRYEIILQQYERIYTHTHDMVCTINEDGFFGVLNPSWGKILRWSNEELRSIHFVDLIHNEDQKEMQLAFSNAKKGNKVLQIKNRVICRSGDIKWLLWDLVPYPEENIIICVARDITETVKLEGEKEVFYKSLIERVKELTFLNNISKLIYRYNAGVRPICKEITELLPYAFQYTHNTYVRITAKGISEETNGFKITQYALKESFETESLGKVSIEVYVDPPETDYRRLFFEEEKSLLAILAEMLNNLIQKTEAEQKEKHSQQKYMELFNSVNDIVFNADKNGNIIDINKEFEIQLGHKIEKSPSIFKYLTQNSIKSLRSRMIECYNKLEEIVKVDIDVITASKKVKTYEMNLKVNYANKKPTNIFGVARDISEQKASQKLLMKTIIDTEEKEKKHFAEELHDGLGPLLSGIRLYLEKITNKKTFNENDRDILKYCNELVNDAIGQVRDISNNLMPVLLERHGLSKSLKVFINKINPIGIVDIMLTGDNVKYNDISGSKSIILYRSITELINNSLKHANAKNININISKKTDKIIVNYSDNGKGFSFKELDLNNSSVGMGLKNLISRVSSVHGTVDFSERKKQGVNAIIEVPT